MDFEVFLTSKIKGLCLGEFLLIFNIQKRKKDLNEVKDTLNFLFARSLWLFIYSIEQFSTVVEPKIAYSSPTSVKSLHYRRVTLDF